MKFGKVTFQKLSVSEPDKAETSESPTPEDHNELDSARTASIHSSRQHILFNHNEQHKPTHNPMPSTTPITQNGHLQVLGNNTTGFPTSTISVNDISGLGMDKQRPMSQPKLGQKTGSRVGNIRYSLLASGTNKPSSDWQYLRPEVIKPPIKTYRNDNVMSKLKKKDLFVAWQNGVIVQHGNTLGRCVNTQTRVSSPTDYRFSYKHTSEYYKPNKSSVMFPLINITQMTIKS